MSTSVRDTAAHCLDKTGSLSVRRHIYGYIWGDMDRTLSLKNHIRLIKGTAFNVCVFLVGHEPDFSGEFTQADAQRMQAAIDVMRELYSQVNLGVRKIYWRYIPVAEAGGFTSVNAAEATELTEAFSGPNDGIDVFYVTEVTDAGGWSKRNGSCDKDKKGERTGAVLELKSTDWFTGILTAHEVGHYLGLAHAGDITNVMGDDSDGDGIGSIDSTSVNLTNSQGNTMKSHCSIKSPC
ncbi:MAG: hypothetical protein R2788_20745 [Saprospiraceae bacterium]